MVHLQQSMPSAAAHFTEAQAEIWIGKLANPAFSELLLPARCSYPLVSHQSGTTAFSAELSRARADTEAGADYSRENWPFWSEQGEHCQNWVTLFRLDPCVKEHCEAQTCAKIQEYLYQLAEAVRRLYPHVDDRYLFGLEVSGAGCTGYDTSSGRY